MLKYLITVSEDLMVVAILSGLLYAFVERNYHKTGQRIMNIGAIVGFASALAMSVLKNSTSLIHTGIWNLRIFSVSTVVLIVFFVFILPGLRKRIPSASAKIACIAAALLVALLVFYEMPDVYAYPVIFRQQNAKSVFSTDFLYRFIGYLGGLILSVLAFFSTRHVAGKVKAKTATVWMSAALTVNAAQQITKALQTMITRRMIKSNHTLFTIVKYTSNYSNWFIYAAMLVVALLAVILWINSFRVDEPYENPAQHRRIRATWRRNRRWASLLLACCLLMVLNMTLFTSIINREVELSPAEDFQIEGDDVYVSLAQVEDGHLHRFAYTTDNGIEVRFIIIKKPNSSAYGIGLDACDICGETGYFERNGQVVCKLCDVVMNINTIGFKGGCNPIPVDYSISNGYVIIPISSLVEHEKEFK